MKELVLKLLEFYRPDARVGHGYGSTPGNSTAGLRNYQAQSVYPYVDEDEYADDEDDDDFIDDDIYQFIKKVNLRYRTSDPLRVKSADYGSFASSGNFNSRVGESRMAPGISPLPGLYKNAGKGVSAGGVSPVVYRTRPGLKGGVGSKKGYASAPPRYYDEEGEDIKFDLLDIFDEDLLDEDDPMESDSV